MNKIYSNGFVINKKTNVPKMGSVRQAAGVFDLPFDQVKVLTGGQFFQLSREGILHSNAIICRHETLTIAHKILKPQKLIVLPFQLCMEGKTFGNIFVGLFMKPGEFGGEFFLKIPLLDFIIFVYGFDLCFDLEEQILSFGFGFFQKSRLFFLESFCQLHQMDILSMLILGFCHLISKTFLTA